jgi:hypothetical protein
MRALLCALRRRLLTSSSMCDSARRTPGWLLGEAPACSVVTDPTACAIRWAQYAESKGQHDEALRLYMNTKDLLGQVRVLCAKGLLDDAMRLCTNTGKTALDGSVDVDRAACFFLAREMEKNGRIPGTHAHPARPLGLAPHPFSPLPLCAWAL